MLLKCFILFLKVEVILEFYECLQDGERGIAVATMSTPLMNKPCLCELVVMVSLEREAIG